MEAFLRILLIDESAAYFREFAGLLAGGTFADAALEHASSAAEGARRMNEAAHDIYFVDSRLPGDGGAELIRSARRGGLKRLIILLTGFDAPPPDPQAAHEGADGTLAKDGFSALTLSRTIRMALSHAASPAMQADAETRFRLAQETVNLAIWEWDAARNDIIWDSQMYQLHGFAPDCGLSPDEMWRRTLPPETCAGLARAMRTCVANGTPFQSDFEVTWHDGSVHHVRCAGRVVRPASGRAGRVIGTNWDITELRLAAAQLAVARDAAQRANQARSRFLAGMSHELRTPLNSVLGYAELLRMEGGLTAAQLGRVQNMLAAGNDLLLMITQVLDLSELEADQVALQIDDVDLQAVAASCIDLIRQQAQAKGLGLRILVTATTMPRVRTDATRLRQILINLLRNAVKFTTAGAITIHVSPDDARDTMRIAVSDTGPGVPADQRARLFQDFGRLDAASTRAAEGPGLGLAMAARLAALLHGRVGHEDNPGGGSVFWLDLPARPDERAKDTDMLAEARPAAAAAPRHLHLLVVDDIWSNCDIAAAFLRAAGHDVVCACSGAAAVAAVAAGPFDAVLMDVRMPGMDGLDATRHIRALGGARGRVPIVGVTALALAEHVKECHAAGMDGHIAKPFTAAALVAAVVRALAAGRIVDPGARPASTAHETSQPDPVGARPPDLTRRDFPARAGDGADGAAHGRQTGSASAPAPVALGSAHS
jgi:PAS domain S-box-containing protein